MGWLDLLTMFIFGALLSLAYKRGVVLEVTQLLALLLAGFMGFRLFRPLADFCHSVLVKGWSIPFLQKFSFFTIFTVVFLAVFSVGLTIERRMKEEKVIEKLTDQRMGVAVGFFQGAWLVTILLGVIFYGNLVPKREVPKLRRGLVVSAFLGLRSFVAPTIYVMMPSDLAKDFMVKGLGQSGR